MWAQWTHDDLGVWNMTKKSQIRGSRRSKFLAIVIFSLPIILLPASVSFASQVTAAEEEGGQGSNLGYLAAAAAVIGSTF
ncbi:MAG: hypothetical protein DRO01_00550, partial [Thermoproteota archaeon]